MQTTDEVRELLEKTIRPRAAKLLKAHKKQTDELRRNLEKLDAALDGKHERLLRLQTKVLKDEIQQLSLRLSMTSRLLNDLSDLDPEDGLGPNLPLVERLTKELGELERKLTKNFNIANARLDMANDALEADDAEIDAGEVTQHWAYAKSELVKIRREFADRKESARTEVGKAKKAVADKDAKALQAALDRALAVRDQRPTVKDMAATNATLWRKYDPKKLPDGVRDQMERDVKEFKTVFENLLGVQEEIGKLVSEIEAMQVAGPDVKKAAKVLGIPSSHLGKLEKALAEESSKLRKMLEALARELQLEHDVKTMLQLLRKAKVVD